MTQKRRVAIVIFFFIIFSIIFPIIKINANLVSVSYQVHLKELGWKKSVYDEKIGEYGGTTGQSRRVEAIIINLDGVDGELTYKVHVEKYGWLKSVKEGEIAGTTGESKRMEAIIINLENSSYNIKYRVHVKELGWLDWVNSGEIAGTTGQCRRIEAIQIVLEKKAEEYEKENKIENIVNNEIGNNQENSNDIIENNQESNNSEIVNNQQSTYNSNSFYLGIDVSKYQGDIDWNKVKKSGINFAIIRCGYRGFSEGNINEDPKFKDNIKNAILSGVKVGIYFYSSAINELESIEEAEYVLNLIDKYDLRRNISYPIVIDIEDFEGTRNFNLSVNERTNNVKAFCEVIKNSGLKPMVYSYTYFLENKLDMDQLLDYDTWIADYYGNTWYNRNYTIWQYTNEGHVEGIDGNVDMNYSYKDY